jgi:hypothetical protein
MMNVMDIHKLLMEKFMRSGYLTGEWFPEVPVGFRSVETSNYPKIDLVCVLGDKDVFHPVKSLREWKEGKISFRGRKIWLIEVEPDLTSATLGLPIGQLLVYKVLFTKDHPDVEIAGLGIVCEKGNPFVEVASKELRIKIWKLSTG